MVWREIHHLSVFDTRRPAVFGFDVRMIEEALRWLEGEELLDIEVTVECEPETIRCPPLVQSMLQFDCKRGKSC